MGVTDNYFLETSTEFHIPGQNFTGPGTHIYSRINSGVLPRNRTDFITMLHDIEYLIAIGDKQTVEADNRAINNLDSFGMGLIAKIGLLGRKHLNLPFNTSLANKHLGLSLMDKVKEESNYKSLWKLYDVDPNLYPG